MIRLRHNVRAFSLVELLAVVFIIAIIIVLIVPPSISILRSIKISQAGQLIEGSMKLARQTAITQNRSVEMRFYNLPGAAGGATAYRAFQLYLYDEKIAGVHPLDKLVSLPDAVILAKNPIGYSTILDNPVTTGTQTLPQLGGGSFAYLGFRFRANGSCDLAPGGPGGSNTNTWFVTVCGEFDPPAGDNPPKNFQTVQVDAVNGAVSSFRP